MNLPPRPRLLVLAVFGLLITVPVDASALVLCAKRTSTGEVRDGSTIKLRAECRANEVVVDPIEAGLQGPEGPPGDPGAQGETGPEGPPGPVPEEVSVIVNDPQPVTWGPYGCGVLSASLSFSASSLDTHDMHSGGAPSQLVVQEAGLYTITLNLRAFTSESAMIGSARAARIRRNGQDLAVDEESSAPQTYKSSISSVAELAAGDVLDAVFSSFTPCGNLLVPFEFARTTFSVVRLASRP